MTDPAKYEALAKDVFNYGSVSMALAMASQTDMLDCLCSADTPLTSADIAGRQRLRERYVREALNSLTAIGLVELKQESAQEEARYWVPPSCRDTLRAYAGFSCFVSVCGKRFGDIKKCFQLDGPHGVRYDADDFQCMERFSVLMVDSISAALLETPGLREKLEAGIQALEVGGGTGWLFLHFAEQFPKSHFTLTDPQPEALQVARKHAEEKKLKNFSVKVLNIFQRPADMPDQSFDWIASVEVIHDLPYPLRALKEIRQLLKPGGHFSLVDHFVPGAIKDNVGDKDAAARYSLSTFLCLPESFQEADSEALGACWGTETACRLVQEAGMTLSGLTRSDNLGSLAVGMCLRPEDPEKK